MTVNRLDKFTTDALTTHKEGEVILSGKTSLGFTGFENQNGVAALSFGFPYEEAPRSYIRKLTLAPKVKAFQLLKKGENIMLTWEISEHKYHKNIPRHDVQNRRSHPHCFPKFPKLT